LQDGGTQPVACGEGAFDGESVGSDGFADGFSALLLRYLTEFLCITKVSAVAV